MSLRFHSLWDSCASILTSVIRCGRVSNKNNAPSRNQDNGGQLLQFLDYVRTHSEYYQTLWRDVKLESRPKLENYPLVDHTSFWGANSLTNNTVLTTKQQNGIVMKTGGTTGNPKLSFWTNDELRAVAKSLALCLKVSGVRSGDRIANLFYAGDLYGSFLLHILSVYEYNAGIQIPIAGHIRTDDMIRHITDLRAEVVLSTVTTMSKIAAQLRRDNKAMHFVSKLLFSGEALYDDQISLLQEAFPNAQVRSLIYGTMECGVIGIPSTAQDPRIHQVLPQMRLEIVTENGPTTISNMPGELVVTNLDRRLMPIVRYSCGDQGEWVDYDQRLFRLLGRQSKSVRLGPVSFDISHIKLCIKRVLGLYDGMQAVLRRFDSKDQLLLRIACQNVNQELAGPAIAHELGKERPMLQEHVEKGLINPVEIEFVSYSELTINNHSGKAIEILDERLKSISGTSDKKNEV